MLEGTLDHYSYTELGKIDKIWGIMQCVQLCYNMTAGLSSPTRLNCIKNEGFVLITHTYVTPLRRKSFTLSLTWHYYVFFWFPRLGICILKNQPAKRSDQITQPEELWWNYVASQQQCETLENWGISSFSVSRQRVWMWWVQRIRGRVHVVTLLCILVNAT